MEKHRRLITLPPAAAFVCAFLAVTRASFGTGGGDFDQEPPTLPFYLHRLPAKTLGEIYDETAPPRPIYRKYIDLPREMEKLPRELMADGAAKTVAHLDELLAFARVTARGSGYWSGGALFNLLYDLRDAASANGAAPSDLERYFTWRIKHADWFGLQTAPGEPTPRWFRDKQETSPERMAEIEEQLAKAPPPLRAQWLYLRGALEFKSGDDTASRLWFQKVLDEFPEHPRAETAAFMVARCAFSQSRSYSFYQERTEPVQSDPEKRAQALALFRSYLEKHPHGRFVADATGWLGAIAFDAKDYAEALRLYVAQTEMRDHPELRDPALHMCELVLSHIASAPQDETLSEVARHPRTAIAMVYLIVNSTEADNFDWQYDDAERVKGWRKNILPRLAAAVATQKSDYAQDGWPPRQLAILALSASGAGRDDDALALTKSAGGAENNDLLFARAVALQRAGKLPEAIATLREFLKKYPRNPLARGVRLRLALALQDDHHAGLAVVQLLALAAEQHGRVERDEVSDSAGAADMSDAEPEQVQQLIDTMLDFAPLAELAEPLAEQGLEDAARLSCSEALACRYLAREDFAAAKRYVTPAAWSLHAAAVEKLAAAAADAKPGAPKAQALLALGDAWAAQRGKLLMRSRDSSTEAWKKASQLTLAQRENAQALYRDVDADKELESLEELRHASACWLRAADQQPASATSAAGIWRALRAMPEIADASPYATKRAQETDAAAHSRELYERLRGECPDSREAKELAVYWTFPPEVAPDYSWGGTYNDWDEFAAAEILGETGEGNYDEGEKWKPIVEEVQKLPALAGDAPALAKAVDDLEKRAAALFHHNDEAAVVNFLDDFRQFLGAGGITPEMLKIYVPLRLQALRRAVSGLWYEFNGFEREEGDADAALREQIRAALARSEMQPAADFLEFLDLAVVANHMIDIRVEGVDKDGEPLTYRDRDYGLIERMSREFLARHPQSAKREADLLVHARAVYFRSRPHRFASELAWAPGTETNHAPPLQFHAQEPFDAKRVLGALDEYDRAYPGGKYTAVIRTYRAGVAVELRDWPQAVKLALEQIDGEEARDCDQAAAMTLARVFAHLADDNDRAAILRLCKADDNDLQRCLEAYLKIDSPDHPLRHLKQFVADECRIYLKD